MKKCVIIPDSFKGTLSSADVCDVVQAAVLRNFPACDAHIVPVADGGEGTVACFLAAMQGGRLVQCTVAGPYGGGEAAGQRTLPHTGDAPEKAGLRAASYGRFGDTAVVEMAMAAGLPLVEGNENPARTTTRGVGQLIRHAVEHGAKKILLGLGGSCTNDAGCGCAAELGVRFFDEDGAAFIPVGETLARVRQYDVSGARALLAGVEISAMCDVDNPLYGETGAAYIFAPQKGADDAMVQMLDGGLRAIGAVMERQPGMAGVCTMPGAGAAGGFGAGVCAFLGGRLVPGIEAVLDMVDFESMLAGCDFVFTGEGRFDSQSMRGKVVSGVAARAKAAGVPVVVLAGDTSAEPDGAREAGVAACFGITRAPMPFSEARKFSRENLAATADNVCRLIEATERL